MNIRPAAVAGYFYPENVDLLNKTITQCIDQASRQLIEAKAIVAPHAGYQYSGAIAANAYQSILHRKPMIQRVVVMGPAHRVPVKGMALSTMDYYSTPLGNIRLDKSTQEQLLDFDFISANDEAHREEHSIEVHLPFLQYLLNEFTLIPIVVGEIEPDDVATVIETLWNDQTLIVISSDLSHFHDYENAKKLDQQTTEAIAQYKIESIGPKQACGCRPLNGLLTFAKQHSYHIETLDVRNSGDTAGSKDRVVGYGAYAIV